MKASYLQKRGWKWPRGLCDSNPDQALHVVSSRNLSLEHRYIKVENLSRCSLLKGTAYSLLLPRWPSFLFFKGPERSNSLNSVSFPISFQCGLLKVSFYCWQPENPAWRKKVPGICEMWVSLTWIAGKDEWLVPGEKDIISKTSQELCVAWLKGRLQRSVRNQVERRSPFLLVWNVLAFLWVMLVDTLLGHNQSCRWAWSQPTEKCAGHLRNGMGLEVSIWWAEAVTNWEPLLKRNKSYGRGRIWGHKIVCKEQNELLSQSARVWILAPSLTLCDWFPYPCILLTSI